MRSSSRSIIAEINKSSADAFLLEAKQLIQDELPGAESNDSWVMVEHRPTIRSKHVFEASQAWEG